MITKPLDDLHNHYMELEQLCFSSNEPIFLKDKRRNRLVLMSGEFYDKLIVGFDMTSFGIRLDIYEVLGAREKPLICAEISGEPVFVSSNGERDIVFMTPALYNALAGKPAADKTDRLKIKLRKKRVYSREGLKMGGAKIYPFKKPSKK